MIISSLSIAAAVFAAELGDKTQLFVLGLAAKEKLRDIIVGVTVATVLLNAMGVYLGAMLSKLFCTEIINLAAGFFFLVFAYLSLGDTEAREGVSKKSRLAALSIAVMFFAAELGDKTQLATIAFAASDSEMQVPAFIGATLGMLLADGAGLVVGVLFGKKLPKKVFSFLAFILFTVFGLCSIANGATELAPKSSALVVCLTATAFFALSMLSFIKRKTAVKTV